MERQGLTDTVQLPSRGNGRQLARREASQLVKERKNPKTKKTGFGSVYYALSVRCQILREKAAVVNDSNVL